jgi:AcrR family transcriptional regulator
MAGRTSPETAIRILGTSHGQLVTSARERMLGEAFVLFYSQGIRAVGIDLIIARSSVAKATFYRHFASKNDLVLAYLDRRQAAWFSWLTDYVDRHADEPGERLLVVFDALADLFGDAAFRGCPLINAVAEVGAESPEVIERAVTHKAQLREFAEGLAREAGVPEPTRAAEHWALLVDGAFVAAQRVPGRAAAHSARLAAQILLQADSGAAAQRGDGAPRKRARRAASGA